MLLANANAKKQITKKLSSAKGCGLFGLCGKDVISSMATKKRLRCDAATLNT